MKDSGKKNLPLNKKKSSAKTGGIKKGVRDSDDVNSEEDAGKKAVDKAKRGTTNFIKGFLIKFVGVPSLLIFLAIIAIISIVAVTASALSVSKNAVEESDPCGNSSSTVSTASDAIATIEGHDTTLTDEQKSDITDTFSSLFNDLAGIDSCGGTQTGDTKGSSGDDYPFRTQKNFFYNGTAMTGSELAHKLGSAATLYGSTSYSIYGYYYNQCVDFVAWRLYKADGYDNPTQAPDTDMYSYLGSASNWLSKWVKKTGGAVRTYAAPGVVAWIGGGYGHVAYVSSISEDNVLTIEEYNVYSTYNEEYSKAHALQYNTFTTTEDHYEYYLWPASVVEKYG